MSNTRISRWVEGLIRLFGNYVLSTYFGSVAILGARDSAVNNKTPCYCGAPGLVGVWAGLTILP